MWFHKALLISDQMGDFREETPQARVARQMTNGLQSAHNM